MAKFRLTVREQTSGHREREFEVEAETLEEAARLQEAEWRAKGDLMADVDWCWHGIDMQVLEGGKPLVGGRKS